MASWSKAKVVDFIELYRENECLWKIRSKNYSNRFLKEKAYKKLIDFVKEFDCEANKDYIVKKINNLRGSFRKEMKKVENSKKSGAGLDDVHKPKLWYFDNLLFLKDEDVVRTTCSSTLTLEPRASSQSSQENEMPLEIKTDVAEVASEVGSEVGAALEEYGPEDMEAEGLLSKIERSAAQTSKSTSRPSKKRRQDAEEEEEDLLRDIRDSMKTNTQLLSQLVGDKSTSPREPFINYLTHTLLNLPEQQYQTMMTKILQLCCRMMSPDD